MARRRDLTSIESNYQEGRAGKRIPVSYDNKRTAVKRWKGRRGVRARARQARINARKENGTYTQPGGGNTTNS